MKYEIIFTIDADNNLCEMAIAMTNFLKYLENETELISVSQKNEKINK